MNEQEIRRILERTLDDYRLTRSEKSALKQVLRDIDPAGQSPAVYRSIAFDLARSAVTDPTAKSVVEWLDDVTKLLARQTEGKPSQRTLARCCFSPQDDCPGQIIGVATRVPLTPSGGMVTG